jgi:hypothetical protein
LPFIAGGATPGCPPVGDRDFEFVVGVYEDVVRSHAVVGYDAVSAEEDDWPPPRRIIDPIDGSFTIYHRGEMRPATEAECRGLETAAVWDEHHLMERLVT